MRHRHNRAEARPVPGADLPGTPVRINLQRSLILFVMFLAATLALWRLVLLKPLLALSRGVIEVSFSLLPLPRAARPN